MRGRLPENKAMPASLPNCFNYGDTPLTTQSEFSSLEPSEEEIEMQEHMRHFREEIQKIMSAPTTKIIPYTLTHREHAALAGIVGIVQQDMQTLQGGLGT